jgi:KipI family sensor histidine kinase inhibitor
VIRSVGDRGLLVEVGSNPAVHALAALLRERFGGVLDDVVPGHETVLVTWASGALAPEVRAALEAFVPGDAVEPPGRRITIAAVYDGPDLDAVARHAGLSPEDVVARHRTGEYRVGFLGFAPGFAYLLGGDPALGVPRRADPRERVPAGSIALAGEYCAVYPNASPGGWQLIGRTEERMFDPGADRPALLRAGDEVRFA